MQRYRDMTRQRFCQHVRGERLQQIRGKFHDIMGIRIFHVVVRGIVASEGGLADGDTVKGVGLSRSSELGVFNG